MADLDNAGGWIKLNRKIWDNFIWDFDSPKYAMAWIDILLMANYKDKKIMFNGKVKTVQRGTFVTSMVKLSERWGMNRRTVKSFLDVLQDSGMITYCASKKCTTVSVTNYLIYQGFAASDVEDTAQLNAQQSAQPTAQLNAQQSAHNIRSKESKEGKERKEILTASNEAVCSTDVQRIVEAWNELNLSKVKKVVPGTNRDALLRARIKDYGAEGILEAIGNIKKSTFLQGGGDKGWVITFDWLIKPNNFPKVLEENYSDNNAPQPQSGSRKGRKEMVPKWMQPGTDTQPNSERVKKNEEWLDRFLEEQEEKKKAAKEEKAGPDFQDRVEALKKRIAEDSNRK